MSVVFRCPSCGTTCATPGECQACGEAQARYFCTNHEPGIWLASPECAKCGARFGAATPRRADRAMPTKVPGTREAERARPVLVAVPRRSSPLPDEPEPATAAPWQTLLESVLRARALAAAERGARRSGPSMGGCLRRVVLIALLLFVVGVVAAWVFGRALLQGL